MTCCESKNINFDNCGSTRAHPLCIFCSDKSSPPTEGHNSSSIMTTPTSGVRGMGEIGAGLSRTRTGPEFIKAPMFNNLILIKKTSTGSDCEFLVGLNDSVGGLN